MSQDKCKIYGNIHDSLSKNPIENVNVTIQGSYIGTTSDSLGYFQLNLPSNNSYTIVFSHINYDKYLRKLFIKNNEEVELNILLKFHPIVLPKVTVTSEKHFEDIRAILTIDQKELKKTGENDAEKALLYLVPDIVYSDWFRSRYSDRNRLYNIYNPNFTLYVNGKLMDSSYLDEININEIKYIKIWEALKTQHTYGEVDMAPIDMPLVEGNYVLLIVTK